MQWQKSSLDDFVHIVFVLVLSAKVVQASAMKVYLLIAKCSLSLPRTQSLPWPFHGQWHGRVAERCSVCGLHRYESLTCTFHPADGTS